MRAHSSYAEFALLSEGFSDPWQAGGGTTFGCGMGFGGTTFAGGWLGWLLDAFGGTTFAGGWLSWLLSAFGGTTFAGGWLA